MLENKLYVFFHQNEVEVFNCKDLYAALLPYEWFELIKIVEFIPQSHYYITKRGKYIVNLNKLFRLCEVDVNKIIDKVTYRETLYV